MEYRELSSGVRMPVIGYGVFQIPPERTERCVRDALEVGYRLIDTAQAYGDYHGAWRALEEAYHDGKLRAIGVSNFYPVRLMDMCAFAEIPPMVNQVETHVFCQQVEAHENMNRLGVVHEAWGRSPKAATECSSAPC